MKKNILTSALAMLGLGGGVKSSQPIGRVRIRNHINANTKPKYRFVEREMMPQGSTWVRKPTGRGIFENLHTGQLESHRIRIEGLSRSAILHFGLN